MSVSAALAVRASRKTGVWRGGLCCRRKPVILVCSPCRRVLSAAESMVCAARRELLQPLYSIGVEMLYIASVSRRGLFSWAGARSKFVRNCFSASARAHSRSCKKESSAGSIAAVSPAQTCSSSTVKVPTSLSGLLSRTHCSAFANDISGSTASHCGPWKLRRRAFISCCALRPRASSGHRYADGVLTHSGVLQTNGMHVEGRGSSAIFETGCDSGA